MVKKTTITMLCDAKNRYLNLNCENKKCFLNHIAILKQNIIATIQV